MKEEEEVCVCVGGGGGGRDSYIRTDVQISKSKPCINCNQSAGCFGGQTTTMVEKTKTKRN